MFFAETLGPAFTPARSRALVEHLKASLGARPAASYEDLHAAVAEFVRKDGSRITAAAAIDYLARAGLIARQNERSFRIAA